MVCLSDADCLSFLTSVSWHVTLGAHKHMCMHTQTLWHKQCPSTGKHWIHSCTFTQKPTCICTHATLRTSWHVSHSGFSCQCFSKTSKLFPGMSDCMTADKRAINISFFFSLANSYFSRAPRLLLKVDVVWHGQIFVSKCLYVCLGPSQQSFFFFFFWSCTLRWSPAHPPHKKIKSCALMHTMPSRYSYKVHPVFLLLSCKRYTPAFSPLYNSGRRPNNCETYTKFTIFTAHSLTPKQTFPCIHTQRRPEEVQGCVFTL